MSAPAARPIRVLTGPTAVGKKEVGFAVARRLGAAVLGMDSVKVYRGLRIGAASPDCDAAAVRVALVGIADPIVPFSTGDWVRAAQKEAEVLEREGFSLLFVGGTPLYLRALLRGLFRGPPADERRRAHWQAVAAREGSRRLHAELSRLDPEAAARIHPHDVKRLVRALEVCEITGTPMSEWWRTSTRRPFDRPLHLVGLLAPEDWLRARQEARARRMFAEGLVEEVRRLRREGRLVGEVAKAIGYREVAEHLDGAFDLEEARRRVVRATWRLTRKQMKWFRRFPEIRWVVRRPEEASDRLVERVLERYREIAAATREG